MNTIRLAAELAELAPVLRRAVALDPATLARVRISGARATVLVHLPFAVLVARSVSLADVPDVPDVPDAPHEPDERDEPGVPHEPDVATTDVTVRADELLAWIDGQRVDPPEPHDAEWRWGTPPASGWRRIDTVPDDVVRGLVHRGAKALDDARERGGEHVARAEVADALLDSVVLTVTSDDDMHTRAEVNLRTLSSVTRMGFLPPGSHIAVDVAGRWTRVAAEYGSAYAERPGTALTLL